MDLPINTDEDFSLSILLYQTRDAVWKIRERELHQHGITVMEAGVLFSIQAIGGNATPAEISRWTFREHQTTTALLNRMEKKGLITRAKDTDRKNIWRVSLTEKGRNAFNQSIERNSVHTALSPLSENERQIFESCLRKIRDHALKQRISKPTIPFP